MKNIEQDRGLVVTLYVNGLNEHYPELAANQ